GWTLACGASRPSISSARSASSSWRYCCTEASGSPKRERALASDEATAAGGEDEEEEDDEDGEGDAEDGDDEEVARAADPLSWRMWRDGIPIGSAGIGFLFLLVG